MASKKLIVLGLDCATPQLLFDRWPGELPHLSSLMRQGVYGPLRSCIPPVTVPAWACMLTGKDPGQLGCYGFRNRSDYSYDGLTFASSKVIKDESVWNILARHNKKVILVGIPQTYPPTAVNGVMVSGFLTPDTSCEYTYPAELSAEIKTLLGDYIIDVENFRTESKDGLLNEIYTMTAQQFRLFSHLLQTRPWDFAMLVEMGIDRMHHAFWKHMDPEHPKYEPGSPYANAVLDYYRFVDAEIGALLAGLGSDTAVLVVSDHGAQPMQGGFCINEWLIREGYLRLSRQPREVTRIDMAAIDWPATQAWGEGGYYARLFLNVAGREPQGAIPAGDYQRVRRELKEKLEATCDQNGKLMGTRVMLPEDVYAATNGIPPDLIVYFGNLAWRSIGSVGLNTIHTFENDLGPDDANHAEDGIFILYDPHLAEGVARGNKMHLSLYAIAPTMLTLLGLPVPADMRGQPLQAVQQPGSSPVYSAEEQAKIRKRLEDLGYL